jgi:cytochrome c553
MKKVFILLSLVCSTFVMAGDVEQGKAKSGMCVACHGADGNSTNPVWPKLAGQHEQYIARQLSLFKNGTRKATVMAGMAAGLSSEDMNNLGAYFASQKTTIGSADENLVDAGKALFQGGRADMKIPACMACHGITGQGNPLSGYPVVAGQHAAYTEQRLKDFRAGDTAGADDDAKGKIMASVAKHLTDDEIKAVATYMQGLYSK